RQFFRPDALGSPFYGLSANPRSSRHCNSPSEKAPATLFFRILKPIRRPPVGNMATRTAAYSLSGGPPALLSAWPPDSASHDRVWLRNTTEASPFTTACANFRKPHASKR